MEKKDCFEKNIKNLVSLYGQEQKMDEEHKKQVLDTLIRKSQAGQTKSQTQFVSFSKMAIAAAAVLIVPAVLAIYFLALSGQKIKIPPELASMSVEELVKLNYDSSQNTFDPNIVKYALKQALEKAAPEEVIKIAKSMNNNRTGMMAQRAAPPVHPIEHFGYANMTFPEVLEESNLFVHAKPVKIDINVEDIIRAIVEKKTMGMLEDFSSSYRVTMQLLVIDSLPKNLLKRGKAITVQTVIDERKLNALKKNSDYYFAMVQDKGTKLRFLGNLSGVYAVDYNSPANVEAWQFFKDAQDILLFGQSPKPETINYWVSKLDGDTFLLALEYMNILPDDLIPAGSIMNAIENRYKDLIAQVQQNYSDAVARGEADIPIYADGNARRLGSDNQPLFVNCINLLLRADDKDSINRMLALFDGDISNGNKCILWRLIESRYITTYRNYQQTSFVSLILRLIIASREGNLSDRLMEAYVKYKDTPLVNNLTSSPSLALRNQKRFSQSLLSVIIDQADAITDEDITPMLSRILENPSEFGIDDTATLKKVWMNLGSRGSYDMRSYLEDFLAEPNLSNIGIELGPDGYSSVFEFEQAAFDALQSLPETKMPTHKELLNQLFVIYERNKDDSGCRTFVNNEFKKILRPEDTEAVPVLEDFLQMEYVRNRGNDTDDVIINIMHDPSLIPFIREAIDKTPNNSDTVSLVEALYACGAEDEAVAKALEMLALPLSQGRAIDLSNDIYRNAALLLFLGKTQREELIPVVEGYTEQEYFDHGMEAGSQFDDPLFDSSLNYYHMINFRQKAIMALARLGGKSAIPRLRQLYNSPDIRIRIVSAMALYYNGDTTGKELVRRFVEGTYRDVPEINVRIGVDMSEKDVFQDVISSYLRNDFTDALWLEKLRHNIDRMSDRDIVGTGLFKDNRTEVLNIFIEQLNNKKTSVRESALEMLRQATGQNFGFQPDRDAGQQEEIMKRWREYIK